MDQQKINSFIEEVLNNMPKDWLKLTTHRLDIYNEALAKTEFIDQFENLFNNNDASVASLAALPTAYDYIRLGHPLSSVLEWAIAQHNYISADNIISFSSKMMPVLAILRTNSLEGKETRIYHTENLPASFDLTSLRNVYDYNFETIKINSVDEIQSFTGSTVLLTQSDAIGRIDLHSAVDFYVQLNKDFGSIVTINGEQNKEYIAAIQHVRRRESIAMTPANCYSALEILLGKQPSEHTSTSIERSRKKVLQNIQEITATDSKPLLGSCGLSVQYAIMMGLIDDAREKHPNKPIKIIVPPNCYGGTNDQARRVAAALANVEIMDLPVDGDNDMVMSTDQVLDRTAAEDAIPYIIAEIPTNPRVEVPDLDQLKAVLSKKRTTPGGTEAVDPVFILDQTFCPNVQFLSQHGIFTEIRTISYVSGSKFPSGGKCTAGYCVANNAGSGLLASIEKHFKICDNEATELQIEILAEQLPSMNQRIKEAYTNTREFVTFIEKVLPEAKINFVSEELAEAGFTPSVFSLDLPTKGDTDTERETYKRRLNHKLIDMMISRIPDESKYCVSYGQLKGCYWTIPATSTQGTTKEADKDYIARVSVSPNLNMDLHKKVFADFVSDIKLEDAQPA